MDGGGSSVKGIRIRFHGPIDEVDRLDLGGGRSEGHVYCERWAWAVVRGSPHVSGMRNV